MSANDVTDQIADACDRYEQSIIAVGKSVIDGTYRYGDSSSDIPALWSEIEGIVDAETARKCIDDVALLEAQLKHARKFGEYASRYAVAEARMWMKIADECDKDPDEFAFSFNRGERAIVDWLHGKGEEERLYIIGRCAKGMRITNQRKEEQAIVQRMNRSKAYQECADSIKDELKQKGTTTLNVGRFYTDWHARRRPDSGTVKAYVEKTRDELLHMGGIGLGDGKGTYILVEHERQSTEEIALAVLNRLRSISADIRRLETICQRAGLSMPEKEIKGLIGQLRGSIGLESQ